MKYLKNNKHKNVLLNICTARDGRASLAGVRGHIQRVWPLFFGLIFQISRRSTSRARVLNDVCSEKVVNQTQSSTSRARVLNAGFGLRRAKLSILGQTQSSTSRARVLNAGFGFEYAQPSLQSGLASRARVLILTIVMVLIGSLMFGITNNDRVQAAPSDTLNFQGRLLGIDGSLVADGYYNIQFNLYTAASGGSSIWTENREYNSGSGSCTGPIDGNDCRVRVSNGYFSVYLGEVTALPNIDYSQQLYLTMNIDQNGTTSAGAITYDGEMNPRFKLTAVPYAFRAANVASGDTNSASTDSSDVSITTGDALGATSNSGDVTIDSGSATGTAGQVLIGTTNASGLLVGNAGATTTIQGSVALTGAGTALTVTNDAQFNGDVTIGSDTSDSLTVEADATFNGSLTVSTGDVFQNAGATLFSATSISDRATGGNIGTAAATVDVATTFDVNQTTAGQTLTLPTPTNTASGRVVYVNNVGSANFTMYGETIETGSSSTFIWNGSTWTTSVSFSNTGVDTVGALDGVAAAANGATISGTTIYLQSASATAAGLVNTSAQTFAGTKTFNNGIVLAANQTLTVTGGTTANRPGSPTAGQIYYDTDTNTLLTYNGTKWIADRGEYTIVAANDSTQVEKDSADYVVDGTSDEDEINLALIDASGGKVLLLAGTYVVDDSISIPNNTTLAGVGSGTVVELDDLDADADLIINTDSATGTGIVVRDMTLDGRSDLNTTGNQRGIQLGAMGGGSGATARQGATIDSVTIRRLRGVGVAIGSSDNTTLSNSRIIANGTGILIGGSDNATISDNIIQGNSNGGVDLTSNEVSFTGNYVQGNTTYGIQLTGSTKVVISGNSITDNTTNGIELFGGSNNDISSNIISDNGADGVNNSGSSNLNIVSNSVSDNTSEGVYSTGGTNISVSGNNLDGNANGINIDGGSSNSSVIGNTVSGSTGYGINIVYNTNMNVSGNTVISSGNYGIGLQGTDMTVSGNKVSASTSYGIGTTGSPLSSSSITGNTVTTSGTYGIYLEGGSSSNVISSNNVSSSSTAGIYLASGSSRSQVNDNRIINSGGATTNQGIYVGGSASVVDNKISDSSASTNNYSIDIQASAVDPYISGNDLGGGSIQDGAASTTYGGQVDASGDYNIQSTGTIELLTDTNITGTLDVTGAASFDGNVIIGDATGDTLTVNAGSIQFANNFTSCTVINTDASGNLGCDTSTYLTSATVSLQGAYNGGNTITTTDARDIIFTLANTATDSSFAIDIATGSTGGFYVADNGTPVFGVTSGGFRFDDGTSSFQSDGDNTTIISNNTYAFLVENAASQDAFWVDADNGVAYGRTLEAQFNVVAGADLYATQYAVGELGLVVGDGSSNYTSITSASQSNDYSVTIPALPGNDTFALLGLSQTFTGLTTLNGGLTVEAGDTFTFNTDAFTDFTGGGLYNNAGVLSVTNTGANGFFQNGGNTGFGGTAILGTNDTNGISIRTNGTERIAIEASGNVVVGAGNLLVGNGATAGILRISDGSSNTVSVDVQALAGDYTVSIPTVTANDEFCLRYEDNCGVGAGASLFTDSGAVTYLTSTSDSLTIGSSTAGGKLFIDGDADEIQLQVQANTSQTADLFVVENSSGSNYFSIDAVGDVTANNRLFVDEESYFGGGLISGTNPATITIAPQNVALPTLDSATELLVTKANTGLSSVNMTLLSGNLGTAGINFGDTDDEDAGYIRYDHDNNRLTVGVNTSDALTIDSTLAATFNGNLNVSGNTTLGDATTDTLTVNGAPTFNVADNSATAFRVLEGANSYINIDTTNGSEKITFDTNTLVVDAANGRVGIGTAAPLAALQVTGDIAVDANRAIKFNAYYDGSNDAYIADGSAIQQWHDDSSDYYRFYAAAPGLQDDPISFQEAFNISLNSATLADVSFDGGTLYVDASTNTVQLNNNVTFAATSGSSGNTITFTDASFQSCTLTTDSSGVLTCGSSGSASDLQGAYVGGNTIVATNAEGDIDLTVSEATNFTVDITGTGNFQVQDGGSPVFTIADGGASTFTGTLQVSGLTTLNGGLTVEAGDTFTFNSDAFTDFTGGGLVNTGGVLSVDTTSASGFFRNGGNSFSGTATLGTNDANSLVLETNNQSAVTIANGGAATFQNASNSTSAFRVRNSAGGNLFNVDTTNGGVEIGGATTQGNLKFSDGSSNFLTVNVGALAFDYTVSIPTISANDTFALLGRVQTFTGQNTFQNASNSTSAFRVNTSGGASLLNVDTTNSLVTVATPVFQTVTNTNCATNCTITQVNVDGNSAIIVNATAEELEITLPDPTNATAGRVVYVTAANGSNDFTLLVNGGGQGNEIAMRANTTATMIWNGNDWTAAGASSSTTLQAAYDNTLTSAGGAEIVLSAAGGNADGLTVRNNATAPIIGGIFEAQTSIGSNLFSVNNNATEYATNGGAETDGSGASTFPASTWDATTGGTVDRYTTTGDNIATGQASVRVQTTSTNHGARNRINTALTPGLTYTVSFAIRATTSFSTLNVLYSPDGSTSGTTNCVTGQRVTSGQWTRVTCTFVAGGSISSSNSILIRQSDSTSRTFYIDNLSINVNASATFAADGSVDSALGSNWTAFGTLDALTRETSVIYDTSGSVAVDTPNAANRGVRNNLAITPEVNTQYLVSFYARSTNTFNDIRVRYSRNGGSNFVTCEDYNTQTVSTTGFTKITCLFTTDGTTASNPDLIIDQPTGSNRIFYIDALIVTLNTDTSNNVQIGGGNRGGPVTLFTLDRSAGAPIADNNEAYLGSMYYDTVTGRIQCYEADGWGACGAAPDNVVNLNPEYAGSVLNGSGVGTMTADFCSNGTDLTVNTSFCDTGEARNYYNWTSPQATEQTYSIYVTYQLPETFNGFSSDDTVQLVGRVDNTSNASVTYEMFHSTGSDVTQCGTGETNVITGGGGAADTWYSYGINGNESTGCALNASAAGDFIIFKINLKAQSNANAYVSTLSFVTTGR